MIGRGYAELVVATLMAGRTALERGPTLFERISKLGAFDAVLAATALEAEADGLVSADAAFAGGPTTQVPRVGLAGAAQVDRRGLDENGHGVALGLEQSLAHVADGPLRPPERQREVTANLDPVEIVAGQDALMRRRARARQNA